MHAECHSVRNARKALPGNEILPLGGCLPAGQTVKTHDTTPAHALMVPATPFSHGKHGWCDVRPIAAPTILSRLEASSTVLPLPRHRRAADGGRGRRAAPRLLSRQTSLPRATAARRRVEHLLHARPDRVVLLGCAAAPGRGSPGSPPACSKRMPPPSWTRTSKQARASPRSSTWTWYCRPSCSTRRFSPTTIPVRLATEIVDLSRWRR